MIPTMNKPFRRNVNISPIMVPATDEPSRYDYATLPGGKLPEGVTSFAMVNAFPIYMRLVGSPMNGTFIPAQDWEGWLIPPGHFGIYSTQFPGYVSALAVERPGFPIYDGNGALLYPEAKLELFYGSGA